MDSEHLDAAMNLTPTEPTPLVTPQSTLEKFLQAVERKTTNPAHRRLLKACRQANPADALETELRKIIAEIINEA
ncbi:MAG: hypothetical protein HY600_01100 [Candidatus Omnitrophica bacterium]|nr:hypothetical protein [Candidatus Omnitrophota bacterium]